LEEKGNQKVLEDLKELQNEIRQLNGQGNQKVLEELKEVQNEIKELKESAKEHRGALREARKQIRNPSSK